MDEDVLRALETHKEVLVKDNNGGIVFFEDLTVVPKEFRKEYTIKAQANARFMVAASEREAKL